MDRKGFGSMEMELHTHFHQPDAAAIICFSLEIGEKGRLMEHLPQQHAATGHRTYGGKPMLFQQWNGDRVPGSVLSPIIYGRNQRILERMEWRIWPRAWKDAPYTKWLNEEWKMENGNGSSPASPVPGPRPRA